MSLKLHLPAQGLHLSDGLSEAAETELQRPEPGEPPAGRCDSGAPAIEPYLPFRASSASAAQARPLSIPVLVPATHSSAERSFPCGYK